MQNIDNQLKDFFSIPQNNISTLSEKKQYFNEELSPRKPIQSNNTICNYLKKYNYKRKRSCARNINRMTEKNIQIR